MNLFKISNSWMPLNDWYDYSMFTDSVFEEIKSNMYKSYLRHSYVYDKDKKEFVITVEVPGFAKEHVSVETSDKMLYIKANRDDKSYDTQLSVNYKLDKERVSATVQDGLLTIIAPIYEEHKNNGLFKVDVK